MASRHTNRLFYVALLLLYKLLFFGIVHLLEIKFLGNDTYFAENQTDITGRDPVVIRDSHRNLNVQPNLSSDSEDCIRSLNQKLIHKEKVKFLNPVLKFLVSPISERIGLFTESDIEFGSVLSLEYPLIDFADSMQNGLDIDIISKTVAEMYKTDQELKRVWENLPVYEGTKGSIRDFNGEYTAFENALDHNARFQSHKIPAHHTAMVYSVIGRVRFDLPPNAMIVVSDKGSGYKAALIATRDIAKGEEITVDHFMDWIEDDYSLSDRQSWCKENGYDLNDKMMSFMRTLKDESLSFTEKQMMMMTSYPNGMIGKNPDELFQRIPSCELGLSSERCAEKKELTHAIISGSIFEEKTTNDQSENEDTLKDFGYDPGTVNERKLMAHPSLTYFLHSALELKYFGDDKQYGIITTKNIPFGSVLVVESPMLLIKTDILQTPFGGEDADTVIESMMEVVDEIVVKRSKSDRQFDRIWNEELRTNKLMLKSWSDRFVDRKKEIPSDRMLMNWAKFNTHCFGSLTGHDPIGVYSVLSRINHGVPQNVAAIFGDEKDGFVLLLIATRDLKEGEELHLDHLQTGLKSKLDSNEWIKQNRAPHFEWIWTEDMRRLIQKMNSLSAPSFSESERKRFLHNHLFSNGIKGKHSGYKLQMIDGICGDWMTKEDCQTTKAMKRDVDSGKVFRLLRKELPAPKWMGEELGGLMKRNLCYTPT